MILSVVMICMLGTPPTPDSCKAQLGMIVEDADQCAWINNRSAEITAEYYEEQGAYILGTRCVLFPTEKVTE